VVAMFLLLVVASISPVTSRLKSIAVTSYRGLRKTKNGEVMCAMDTANETISSSSQQQCSLRCARDVTCIGFNIKNQLTCDLYNYQPQFTTLVSACMFYQVNIPFLSVISDMLTCTRVSVNRTLW